MWLIDRLAEARIAEALERGDFDDLAGSGRPLELEDDALVPEELRAAYRLLRNAGYLPPELALRREIADLHQLLACIDEGAERDSCMRRLNFLLARLGTQQGRELSAAVQSRYLEKLCQRLDPPPRDIPDHE